MDRYLEIKRRLLRFAESNGDLLAVIAIGSTVREYAGADAYSDLDLILVCTNPADWLFGDLPDLLGEAKISFVEPTFAGGMERRILYNGSLDVDMIVLTPEQMDLALSSGVAAEVMSRGYCVLYDDRNVSEKLKALPMTVPRREMTEHEFSNTVNDFWFHAVWSAKKILRGELWAAKMCIDAYMKGLLLKIMEASEWDSKDVWHNGRFLEKWASGDTLAALGAGFAHYDQEDMIRALFHTGALFGKLANGIAQKQGFTYPEEAECYARSLMKAYWETDSEYAEITETEL